MECYTERIKMHFIHANRKNTFNDRKKYAVLYQKTDDQVQNSESENTYNIRGGGKESITNQTRTIKNHKK